MSKRIKVMNASESMESICNTIDLLAWLLDVDDGEEDECEDMMECAEAHGMVGLPRDADGEPIHIGDLVRIEDDAFHVDELRLLDGGEDGCIWKVVKGAGALIPALIPAEALHHVAEDTPEGILLEAVMRAHCDTLLRKDGTDVSDLIERLRNLMGGCDE